MAMHKLFRFIAYPYYKYGNTVSSHDVLKACALYFMIIDHIGLYIHTNVIMYRVIGRVSFCIWFYLVGYNFYNKTSRILVLSAVFLQLGEFILNGTLLPLNVLFSIIICRKALAFYVPYACKLTNYHWIFLVLLSIMIYLPSNVFFEYGVLGIIVALWGYNIKNNIGNKFVQTAVVLTAMSITQIINFQFDFTNSLICIFLMSACVRVLYNYKFLIYNKNSFSSYKIPDQVFKHNIFASFAIIFNNLSFGLFNLGCGVINISSRYSLYIYVVHKLFFQWYYLNLYSSLN
jgi:hypothetical protein